MLFNFDSADTSVGGALVNRSHSRWGTDSEYGRLTDVMLSAPAHLELVACNAVATENHRNGLSCSTDVAALQHAKLVEALEARGVGCHFVPPVKGLPDLSFSRDATTMTPWGLLGLRPAVEHRLPEVQHTLETARAWGVPLLGTLSEGRVEGGDVCVLRPGVVIIGYSGERTDERGANALARLFEARGWKAILYRFDPHFLHLDTQFTIVDRDRAVACVDRLEGDFLRQLEALGIDLVPVTYDEVQNLGANIFCLGEGRLVSSADNSRVNAVLEGLGYEVAAVEVDQFTRCGGGIHCLTMPLARETG
jgi:N-dimethylarginine dimethylaminohydrolase